jgi:hypothetical protein
MDCQPANVELVLPAPASIARPIPRRLRALAILSVLALVLGFGFRQSENIPTPRRQAGQPSDAVLHTRIVAGLVHGQSYYEVVGQELRRHGYPTRSAFNWRTPAHYELVARLSPERASMVLRWLALGVMFGAMWAFANVSTPRSISAGFFMLGSMLVPLMLSDAVVFGEAWAGTFIGLSLACYVRGRWFVLGACLGIGAVFLREIAVPYAVTCGLLALIGRRRAESMTWMVGGAAYLVYYALHAMNVAQQIQPTDVAHTESWLQFQGLPFVLRTLHGNGWLVLMPVWLSVVICVLALAAVLTSPLPQAVRWPLLAYVAFFSVAGQPFNFYWGWVSIPLWTYAFMYADKAIWRLLSDVLALGHARASAQRLLQCPLVQ